MPQSRSTIMKRKKDEEQTMIKYFDPLKPRFYIVKLGFIGVYIIFRISVKTWIVGTRILRGGSNEYPQSMFEQK